MTKNELPSTKEINGATWKLCSASLFSFYYSYISGAVDDCEERLRDYLADDYGRDFPDINIEWNPDMWESIARDFVDWLPAGIYQVTENHTGRNSQSLKWINTPEFVQLDSPKDYFQGGDIVSFYLPWSEIVKVYAWILQYAAAEFREFIKETFEARSGFIPFYSNDINEWGQLDSWNDVQLGQLFRFLDYLSKENQGMDLECLYVDADQGSNNLDSIIEDNAHWETGVESNPQWIPELAEFLPTAAAV